MRTREEQIAQLKNFVASIFPDMRPSAKQALNAVAKAYIEEAEERARAECAADTRRLEWLEKLPFADVGRLPNGWEICINNVRHWDMQPTLREAIDAAMDGGK